MVDLDFKTTRLHVEILLNNESIFIKNEEGKIQRIFVKEKDYEKCREEPPFDMRKKGCTKAVKLQYEKFLFGGIGPAKVLEVINTDKEPVIMKQKEQGDEICLTNHNNMI